MNMTAKDAYDVIVIGAGHNGLTAAALLAKQGRKVLILERRSLIGGLAAGEEFHPGYHSCGVLHDTGQVRARVVRLLGLKSHGLEMSRQRPSVLALDPEGRGMLLGGKDHQTAKEIRSYSAEDAEQYLKYHKFIKRVARVINRILDQPPPAVESPDGRSNWGLFRTGLALRQLGKTAMHEFLRIAPMCVADWLNEWFGNNCLKASLAAAALTGSYAGPWSPGTTFNLLLWECSAKNSIKGGPRALIDALAKAAQSQGVEIRTESEVGELQISGEQIKGVVLKSGEPILAPIVAASCDPRHTFRRENNVCQDGPSFGSDRKDL
jgi:phytoene dehydrogenase-like protein